SVSEARHGCASAVCRHAGHAATHRGRLALLIPGARAMRRFTFSLEQLLRLKRQRERLAELRQNQASLALQKTRAEVASLWERLAGAAAEFEAQSGQPGRVTFWIASSRHVDQLRQTLAEAEAKARRAEQDWQSAAAARKQAAIEVEALLALRR